MSDAETEHRSAFDAALKALALREPEIEGDWGQRHILVPDGFKLQDISDRFALPPYPQQTVTVDVRGSLSQYVNRFSTDRSVIVADYDRGRITAVIDYHASNATGPDVDADHLDAALALSAVEQESAAFSSRTGACKHTCALVLRPSEEFKRWDAFEGDMHAQVEFAEFLEENAQDVVVPDPGVLLEISRDLEVSVDSAFKSSNRLESGDRKFVYETETKVKGELVVPREFCVEIPLYAGEAPVQIKAALRFRPRADGLRLGFVWRRVEYQRMAHFEQITHTITEETGRPVFFGRL